MEFFKLYDTIAASARQVSRYDSGACVKPTTRSSGIRFRRWVRLCNNAGIWHADIIVSAFLSRFAAPVAMREAA